ncbi:MAG: hypothetical protein ACTHM5_06925 [Ginsengibacter sp.]
MKYIPLPSNEHIRNSTYHKELEKIIHYGGSKKETAIRNSFYNLLNEYARSKDLMLIPEISTKNKGGKIITPDGTKACTESEVINFMIRNVPYRETLLRR